MSYIKNCKFLNTLLLLATLSTLAACPGGSSSNNTGGSNGNGDSGNPNTTPFTGTVTFPFDYQFDPATGKLLINVNGQLFPADFGAWGSHAGGHGGHMEGDLKANYSIYIQPSTGQIEFKNNANNPTGNNDGICDNGEICGVTAATAFANAPWYISTMDDMELTDVSANQGSSSSDHIDGENAQWGLTFSFHGTDTYYNLGHLGEISEYIKDKLRERFGSQFDTDPTGISYSRNLYLNPIPIAKGELLARPQITYSFTANVNSQKIYYAHAQAEWGFNEGTSKKCLYNIFTPSDQLLLQSAMDRNLTSPVPFGRFVGYSTATQIDIITAAESTICAGDEAKYDNFNRLDTVDSYTWIGEPMGIREVLAIFPVNKTTATYDALKSNYYSADVNYVLKRGFLNSDQLITLRSGASTYTLTHYSAEILNLPDSQVGVGASGTLITKIFIPNDANPSNAPYIISGGSINATRFMAISYRLTESQLMVRWGELAATAETTVAPSIPDQGDTCDGSTTFCYNHNGDYLYD